MQRGKFNVVLDGMWGSSGKGKVSTFLAEKYGSLNVSSANFPNAGHTAKFASGTKFIAKAIPTSAILKHENGTNLTCWVSPASGFNWHQVVKEWKEAGKPKIRIHERASVVTEDHARREREGAESTVHIASTMQGSATAMVDKILRKADCKLASFNLVDIEKWLSHAFGDELAFEFMSSVTVDKANVFRDGTHAGVHSDTPWLHEGSQGYALSIDHGSHYPQCTSRNCTVQMAMDSMAVPPQLIGDVYLNLRTYPIRVGNVVDADGTQRGHSGDFYPDCQELTWAEVAQNSGMPKEEADALAERERTTVTKRIRRVCTFSYDGLEDAVRTNGATKLSMNFIQYINWKDAGLRGGREAFRKLSPESRLFLDKVEDVCGVQVVLIGTGADHEDMISLL